MPKERIPERLKRIVAARANYRCEFCQCLKAFVPDPFRTDHIHPESKGGKTVLENLAQICDGCHGHKYDKTEAVDPQSGQAAPLFNPRKEAWATHFKWSKDPKLVEGLTPTGRATIRLLDMNRTELANLRTVLKIVGKHPPT